MIWQELDYLFLVVGREEVQYVQGFAFRPEEAYTVHISCILLDLFNDATFLPNSLISQSSNTERNSVRSIVIITISVKKYLDGINLTQWFKDLTDSSSNGYKNT